MGGLWVRDVMTPDVTTLKRNDKLTLADDIMHLGRIRLFQCWTMTGSRLWEW